MIIGQSSEFLLELRKSCQDQIGDIDRELKRREQEQIEINRQKLVRDWDELVRGSYFEGYYVGVRHNGGCRPGGPYVSSPCRRDQYHRTDMTFEEYIARCELSRIRKEEWFRGFEEGAEERELIISKRKF